MSKMINRALMAGAALVAMSAVPGIASAQSANGITNCDAPGGRQQAGALIGGVLGALAGSQISDNERELGAVAGAAAGAAAGSYVGCRQQRERARQAPQAQQGSATVRATSNLRVRSGPGTNYRQIGSLSAGQSAQVAGSEGEWVQLTNGGWVSAHYLTY
ncbi:SH3 domain-containing protein [Brevundimonas sp.]|uniref:SH3 domain-containing protein n=1 Tax=Brevundimonas sp. TaxID=1871086 RepID=UPI003AF770E1